MDEEFILWYNNIVQHNSLPIRKETYLMAVERRKDSSRKVLKEGEYQRANGTYEYRWTDYKGVRHSLYAKTLKELRVLEDQQIHDSVEGLEVCRKDLTINDLYELWIRIKRGLKDNTFQNYKYMYTQFVQDGFGKRTIWNLKRTDVRAFYNTLADEKGLKPATIDSIHSVLHQVLELAVEDEYLRYNPADKALKELKKAHADVSEKKRSLTVEEQELFESFLKNSEEYGKWWPIFTVMLWTGMRVGEITGLRWSDVDFDAGIIHVNHTLVYYDKGKKAGMTFAINTPKSKAGQRTIPMLPIVREALEQERKNQAESGICCKVTVDAYTDFIFVNRYGGVQHQGTLNKALARIIRDCNYEQLDSHQGKENVLLLPHFSNHSLRHTFTTRMCEANVNVKAMQAILGHADAVTTLDIYADATDHLKQAELIHFADYFQKRQPVKTGVC